MNTVDPIDRRPLPLGYDPGVLTKGERQAIHRTRWANSFLALTGDHLGIVASAACGLWAWMTLPLAVSVPLHVLLFLITARCMRGLESLVHEGSHYNLTRRKGLNDVTANVLAAFPVGTTVGAYRYYHMPHHRCFGVPGKDTDLDRYEDLGIEEMRRDQAFDFVKRMTILMPKYTLDWWRAIGTNPIRVGACLLWHVVTWVAPLTLVFDFGFALSLWGVYWWVPFVFFLSPLRFLAESGEHEYKGAASIVEGSISNIGRLGHWWLHPHHDGYHALHHVLAGVPHHRLQKAHTLLMQRSAGFEASQRVRTKIFQRPIGPKGGAA